jgi:hypothetical protein
MKRAIVVMATTLILTAGQALAEKAQNGLSLAFRVPCHCTCLEAGCCPKGDDCDDDAFVGADSRPHGVRPNTARLKLFERTTNRYSTPIPGATP